jgi:hypothetical protein
MNGCDCGGLARNDTPMSETVDPFELLRELNPVKPADVANAASSEHAVRSLEEIVTGTRDTPRKETIRRRRVPRLRRRSYVLGLIPVAGVIAVTAWALTQGSTKQLTIGCYATANLQAHTVVVPANNRPPVETCREVWRTFQFGHRPTPKLQACVLPSGAIAVFPSPQGQACKQLKLAPLLTVTTPYGRTSRSPLRLKNALVKSFLTKRCVEGRRATALVRSEIRRLGLPLWRVQINGVFTTNRPCASLAFDEDHNLVLLIPIPRRP